jgi:hypothetical protein
LALFDIKLYDARPTSRDAERLPAGSGLALCGLGALMTLALIAVALITGQQLWVIMILWIAVGPAIVFGLALVALTGRSVPRADEVDPTRLLQEGRVQEGWALEGWAQEGRARHV